MAIAENPKRSTSREAKAEQFIAKAGKQTGGDVARKPIMIRIQPDMLERIDKGAKRLGLTRTGFIISSTAEKLERMESGS
jgi:hypothetical protein